MAMGPPLALQLVGVPANTPRALAFQLKTALALQRTPDIALLSNGTAMVMFTSATDYAKVDGGAIEVFGVPVTPVRICSTRSATVPKLVACDGRRVRIEIVSDTM